MIAPLAIALALAFWTPINGGANPCPDGVNIQPLASAEWDGLATFDAGCTIQIRDSASQYPLPQQCALVAHELGHSVFALGHEPGTIMDPATATRPIPGVCYPAARVVWRPGKKTRRAR
jgi:hypothetical protein